MPNNNDTTNGPDAPQSPENTLGQGATYVAPTELQEVRAFVQEESAPAGNPLLVVLRIFRGLWLPTIGGGMIVGLLLAVLAYQLISPKYTSNGLVRLVAKQPKIMYADRDDSRLRLYDAFVSAEATYIQSQPVIERGFETLKNDENAQVPADFKQQNFIDMLTIKKEKGLIAVSASSSKPVLAQRAVHSLLDAYVALHAEQNGSRQSVRARELEVRVLELESKQRQLSSELLEVGEEYDASSLAKAHLTKVTQLEELDLRIEELTNALIEMEASDGALDADTGDMEIKRATLLDRAMADMVFERAKRAAELEKLQLRYKRTHPKVATLQASLDVIDEAIETRRRLIATLGKTGAITGGDGAAKSQSLAELQALKRKLTNRRDELSDATRKLNGKLIQLRRINAEKAEVTGMLAETRRILDQVILESRNSMPGTIEILSRGSTPENPSSDKRKQLAAAALVMGGGLVVVLVFLWRQLSGTIIYSDDIGAEAASPVGTTVFGDRVDRHAMANFMNELQMSPLWPRKDTAIFSLVGFDDDHSFPLEKLAEMSAKQGYRTLLVHTSDDCMESEQGFAEQILNKAELKAENQGSYDFISYGKRSLVSGYSVERAQAWLAHYSRQYDLILLHAGQAEKHFSARILPNLSDATIVVMHPGNGTRQVRRILSRLRNMVPIFTNARPNDPGLENVSKVSPLTKGESHENAA